MVSRHRRNSDENQRRTNQGRTFYPTVDNRERGEILRNGAGEGRDQMQNGEGSVLYVSKLCGPGMRISVRDLVYAFNHAAQPDDTSEEHQVLDVYYPINSPFAHIQMRSEEAAKQAKERLHRSWLFDKYIYVEYGRKRSYPNFHSNRAEPSPRVTFGAHKTNSLNATDTGGDNESAEGAEQMRQNAFIAKMPIGVTRHLLPGTINPNGINNSYIARCTTDQAYDEDDREVERERFPETPVLFVTGIENRMSGKMLTRYDLIMLFSCYGVVVDCDVYLPRRICAPNELPNRHHALVQMECAEQATRAMHALDYTWQMGRFMKVTYAREKSIQQINNEEIKKIRENKNKKRDGEGNCGRNDQMNSVINGAAETVDSKGKDDNNNKDENDTKEQSS